jgi:hypothetical protein
MQIRSSARQDLPMVNRYRPVAGHNAKQLPLLGSLPAPYASANRSGHRIRLTWQSRWSIPSRGRVRFGAGPRIRLISRLPSQGGSRVLIEVKLPTSAILRRQLLAGRKVPPPFWLEGLADPDGSAVKERVSDALKRP